MQQYLVLPGAIQNTLRCPICGAKLEGQDECFRCINATCNTLFPIVQGVPILIDDNSSIFSISDFVGYRETTSSYLHKSKFRQLLSQCLPKISRNMKSRENYNKLAKLLLGRLHTAKLLVIGGSIVGEGMEALLSYPKIELVESDVTFGPRTKLVCDAHSLPFEDNSFDCVIVQAVLEHVVDPWRCVEEIHRVLKEDGLVYAETPFMQQVHTGRYDFTRFTHLGHRRLFRKFEEIESGAVCGPAMALAWSYTYFLMSFSTSGLLRKLIKVFAKLTSFFLVYFDYVLINKPGSLDAASAYYFMGKKSNQILSDKELVKLYKGLDYNYTSKVARAAKQKA